MNADVLYCIMDDADVELDAPIELSEEIMEKDAEIEEMIMERHPELFK